MMKKCKSTCHEKLERKIAERNRRIHMKGLLHKLTSLVPPHHFNSSKGMLSQEEQLNVAERYVKLLENRVEELKARRTALAMSNNNGSTSRIKLPVIELREHLGSSLEVVLITGLKKNFMMYEVIGVMEDEGTEVVSARFSTVGDEVFHTLHAKVKVSRVGVDAASICRRLKELVC